MKENKYLKQKIDEIMNMGMAFDSYFKHKEKSKSGTSMIQLEALMLLSTRPGITMNELSKFLKISMPATTKVIDLLISNDFVSRIFDKDDRRKVKLLITPKGLADLDERKKIFREQMIEIFQDLTKKEIDIYLSIQHKLVKRMQSIFGELN